MVTDRTRQDSSGLDRVCERLDALISLLMPSAVGPIDPPKGLQLDIFKLCDYEHTTEEIRQAVGKKQTHVNKELSLLRSKGLIRSVPRDGRQVHIRVK
jgi:hypothetical protein